MSTTYTYDRSRDRDARIARRLHAPSLRYPVANDHDTPVVSRPTRNLISSCRWDLVLMLWANLIVWAGLIVGARQLLILIRGAL